MQQLSYHINSAQKIQNGQFFSTTRGRIHEEKTQIDHRYNKKLFKTIDRSHQTSSDNHAQDNFDLNLDVYHNCKNSLIYRLAPLH